MNSKEESVKLRQEFAACQKMLTALGDETRQQLLSIMIMGPCSGMRVIDIAEQTSLSRPAVSHHMQILKDAGADGRFALLYSDGGYATRSWREMILPGIASDREQQRRSLAWIREQSLSPECVESIANHDPDIKPHVIGLR